MSHRHGSFQACARPGLCQTWPVSDLRHAPDSHRTACLTRFVRCYLFAWPVLPFHICVPPMRWRAYARSGALAAALLQRRFAALQRCTFCPVCATLGLCHVLDTSAWLALCVRHHGVLCCFPQIFDFASRAMAHSMCQSVMWGTLVSGLISSNDACHLLQSTVSQYYVL